MLLLCALATAASLDNLEIGGPWGSPTSTDGTAGWWNPAGFAVGKGTRIELEGAYEDAVITFDRADPHGGKDTYKLSGFPPYFGLASTLGKVGPGQLGVGAVLALPFIRGGSEVDPPGTGHYHMKDGDTKGMWMGVGVAYDVQNIVSIGVTGALVHSIWAAEVDQDTLPDLRAAMMEATGSSAETLGYTEEDLEDPDYMAELDFGGSEGGLSGNGELSHDAFSFSAGVLVHPSDKFAIGVTYVHNAVVENTGDVDVSFGCVSAEKDPIGQAVASTRGVCDTTVHADGYLGYTLPRRVHGGVMVRPIDPLRLELMGGWVQWSEYSDFHIKVSNADVQGTTDAFTEEAKALIEQERDWARDNEDTFWAALDAKVKPHRRWTVGARYWFDHHAVPDHALSANNWDADTHMVSGLVAYKPTKFLEVGVSYTHHFVAERTIDSSSFSNPLDMASVDDRWRYPHGNGTYNGSIDRIGLQLRGHFGKDQPE